MIRIVPYVRINFNGFRDIEILWKSFFWKVIFFMIPGNMGGFIQIPPIVNSIENYTAYMNEQQNEIHYYSDSYGFDF